MNRMEARLYPVWFEFERSERAYKKIGGPLPLHLPGRGESTISNVDGLRQLSPLHLGRGRLLVSSSGGIHVIIYNSGG